MTLAEVADLVGKGGLLVFAAFVLQELRLIRPVLQSILLFLASEASPEQTTRVRKLTPPPLPPNTRRPDG